MDEYVPPELVARCTSYVAAPVTTLQVTVTLSQYVPSLAETLPGADGVALR
jgi:hypothetical protein